MLRARQILLLGLLAIGCGALAGQRPAADRVRQELARILAKPEYQDTYPGWLRDLLRRVLAWLSRLFSGWWGEGVYQLRETWPALYWAIVVILLGLLSVLVYHMAWTLLLALGRQRRTAQVAAVRKWEPPESLRRRAERLAAAGRFGEAVRVLHEALIRFLDVQGLLRFDRAQTNWEYLEAVRQVPALVTELEPLTLRLDGVLYGGRPADAQEYAACAALVARAWQAAEAVS